MGAPLQAPGGAYTQGMWGYDSTRMRIVVSLAGGSLAAVAVTLRRFALEAGEAR
jgi:hypothetical protein